MEIITYNADGTINETKHIDLQVPEYVKKYDEQNSFLNITADEVEALKTRKNTFRKTLLLRQLTAAIKHDYANFRDAYKMEADNLEVDIDVFMKEAESDPQIQSGDRIISSIMRIYSNRSQLRRTEINISEQTFLEQTCTEEEFLIYIDNVEPQMANDNGNITSANWIKVIMYHAFKGAESIRLKYGDVEEEARFYISLQNLINRYYYSLRNMEGAAYWMPAELKHQMNVLRAFVKKIDMRNVYRFDKSRFFIKLINALYLMNEKQRGILYKMADIVLGYNPIIGFNNQILQSFCIKEVPKHEVKEYKVTFYDYNKAPYRCLIIDENEIYSLRIPSSANGAFTELKECLKELNSHHVVAYQQQWVKNVETDYGIYSNKQKPYHEDWLGFYDHMIEEYRTVSINDDDWYKPQRCFFLLVCNNVHPNEKLDFDTEIIFDLIDLLKKDTSEKEDSHGSQVGLYECMFKINYIKGHIVQRSDSDEAISKAMKYLEPLFSSDCKYVGGKYREKLSHLIKQLLSSQGIKSQISNNTPNGFTGGFNLILVYYILGFLRERGLPKIITCGQQKIDDYLNEKAIENRLIHEDDKSNRKNYISTKNDTYKDFRSEIERIIDSFTGQMKKV